MHMCMCSMGHIIGVFIYLMCVLPTCFLNIIIHAKREEKFSLFYLAEMHHTFPDFSVEGV